MTLKVFACAGLGACLMAAASCASDASSPAALGPPSAMHVDARFPGPDGGWDFSTFDPVHRRVYVSRSDGVTALDLASGAVTGQLVHGSHTHIALPVNAGADILVTDGGSGGVFIADAITGARRGNVIATGAHPDAAMIEPTTGLVWVMDNRNEGIAIIDARAGRLAGHINVEGALESPVSDGHGAVYVTVEDKSEIAMIDVRTRSVAGHFRLADCEEPSGLAYDAHDARLIAECANGALKIVSARDGALLASLPLGPRPDGLITDERRRLVYAPTGGDGTMSVIDPARLQVVATISTRTGARSGAIDTANGHIYLPSGEFTPPVAPGGRPVLTPGSFQILQIGAGAS